MTAPDEVSAVILAAGRSQRFGDDNKLLHEIDGVPILRRTVEAVLGASLLDVVVVTGFEADRTERALAGLDVRCVRNATPWAGMGASLAVGANAVDDRSKAMFVLLGDMLRLQTQTLLEMMAAFDPTRGQDILVPVCDGRRGHPVLFAKRYFVRLRALSGDVGAKGVLTDHPERVQAIDVNDPGTLFDVDTRDDLSR